MAPNRAEAERVRMNASSPLQAPVDIAPGFRLRRAKNERGEPIIELHCLSGFAKGEVSEIESFDQLQFLYCWLGSAIAAIRAYQFTQRKEAACPVP